MTQVRATLTGPDDTGWTATVPGIGRVSTDDPVSADFQVRRLVAEHRGLDSSAADDLEILLVDADDRVVYAFDLLFTGPGERADGDAERRYAALSANPPAGCRFEDRGDYPTLRCLRPGTDRFDAISGVVAEVRDRFGLDANDLGFEKLWEWFGGRDRREEMIAHLLLMATERARWTGVPAEQLVAFVRTAMGSRGTDF
jgi:hypothetical protein